jgi:chromosome partitioning protein
MLIAVAAEKGGVGKTTIATNLAGMSAARGHSVMLTDTDVEESTGRYAYAWGMARRDTEGLPSINLAMLRGNIYTDLLAQKERYDVVIVDVPAGNGLEMRLACMAADVIVIPLGIGQYDTSGMGPMVKLANEMRQTRPDTRVYAVLNNVPFNAKNDLRDSLEMLDTLHDYLRRTSKYIVGRQAFRASARSGRAVTELEKPLQDPKASEEITSLYEEVFNG